MGQSEIPLTNGKKKHPKKTTKLYDSDEDELDVQGSVKDVVMEDKCPESKNTIGDLMKTKMGATVTSKDDISR